VICSRIKSTVFLIATLYDFLISTKTPSTSKRAQSGLKDLKSMEVLQWPFVFLHNLLLLYPLFLS
jgi:hypothetical protein